MASITIDTDAAGIAAASHTLTDGTVLKTKLFTGTTGASEGSNVEINLDSIDADKVVSVEGLVNYTLSRWVNGGFTGTAGYNFSAYVIDLVMRLRLHPTESEGLLSKPFKVIVTYYE